MRIYGKMIWDLLLLCKGLGLVGIMWLDLKCVEIDFWGMVGLVCGRLWYGWVCGGWFVLGFGLVIVLVMIFFFFL